MGNKSGLPRIPTKDLTPYGIQQGGGSKNLTGQWNRASRNSAFKTAKKTISQLRYDNTFYPDKVFAPVKQTIAGAYEKVISRQYPKYTGPKPPYTNPRGGGNPGAYIRVQGHPMRAAGKFSTIPEGYLVNLSNQKHLAARTARVAKGVAKVAKVGRIATPVGAAMATYDAMKWSKDWHKNNPDYAKQKYKKYGTKGY